MYMVQKTLANTLKFMGEMACTKMDIKMKKFYLDMLQILTVGEFTGYVTFEKRWIQKLPSPLQTLPLELVEVNTQ